MADFLDEAFPAAEGEAPEAPEPPVEAPAEVVAPEPEPEPAPEPAPEADAPKDDSQRTIPLATALDWRDQAKEAKRRIAELESNTQRPAPPSLFDDSDAYNGYVQEQVNAALTSQRMAMSDVMARQSYGADTVEKAAEWASSRAETDPTFRASWAQTLQTNAHPIDWIVQQHRQNEVLGQIGNRPLDDFIQDYIAKNPDKFAMAQAAPAIPVAAVAQPAHKPAPPPRSIAADSGNGSVSTASDPRAEFLSIFEKQA